MQSSTPQFNEHPSTGETILQTAIALLNAGVSVIPIRTNGKKSPAIETWKPFQKSLMTEEQAEQNFNKNCGLAIVCGAVSGNLEVLDFDAPELFEPWKDLVTLESPDLIQKLTQVRTPSGGMHVYFRCNKIDFNKKLAMGPGKPNKEGRHKKQVLIETRGEGGYVLAPPSPVKCHPSNKPYILILGKLENIPHITEQERETLLFSARTFHQLPNFDEGEPNKLPMTVSETLRPGDDFNQRASWDEILIPTGWKPVKSKGTIRYWKRPGDSTHPYQANTGYCTSSSGDLFYVFSTNSSPFKEDTAYSKFSAYTFLNHNGNFQKASHELNLKNYGNKIECKTPPKKTEFIPEKKFSFISAEEIVQNHKKVDWIIKPYLDAGSLAVLFGEAGVMKSFVALDIGLSVATGADWHGSPIRKNGPVFYLAGEGFTGLSCRIRAWSINQNIELAGIPFFISEQPAQLLDTSNSNEVVIAIEKLRTSQGSPVLIIIDTLNRNFGPGDENSTADMTRFISTIDTHIRNRYACAVMIIHHSGLATKERARGASALHAALDWEYLLKKGTDDSKILSCTKVKDHASPPTISFKPKTISLDPWVDELDGKVVTSCVIQKAENPSKISESGLLQGAKKIAFETLKKLVEPGKDKLNDYTLNDFNGIHIDIWRKAAYEANISKSRSSNSKKKAFQRATSSLLDDDYVEVKNDYWRPRQDKSGTKTGHVLKVNSGQTGHVSKDMSICPKTQIVST